MSVKANLVIDQGSTFEATLTLTDDNGDKVPLSEQTASSQIRKWFTSSNSVSFDTSINTTDSTITLSLSANQTMSLVAGRYVYDVELTNSYSGAVSRIVEGIVTVTPNVTR